MGQLCCAGQVGSGYGSFGNFEMAARILEPTIFLILSLSKDEDRLSNHALRTETGKTALDKHSASFDKLRMRGMEDAAFMPKFQSLPNLP
jgi:hypothetical protein